MAQRYPLMAFRMTNDEKLAVHGLHVREPLIVPDPDRFGLGQHLWPYAEYAVYSVAVKLV